MKRLQVNTSFVWLFAIVAGLILSLGMIRSAGRKLSRPAQNSARTSVALLTLPHIILWAWERPEKLDFIEKDEAGIAFLAKTLYLRGERVVSRPRLQPLLVSPGVALVAVARIEPSASEPASLSPAQMESAAHEIAELAKLPNVVTVQVDFDARTSERAFYSELLIHVRQALPATMALSITALASWCKGDNWLDSLPINEAIPMLFRMGIDLTRRQLNAFMFSIRTRGRPTPSKRSWRDINDESKIPSLPFGVASDPDSVLYFPTLVRVWTIYARCRFHFCGASGVSPGKVCRW